MNYSNLQFIKDLAQLLKPYKGYFFIGVITRLLSDIARLYPTWALSILIPLLAEARNEKTFSTIVMLLSYWGVAVVVMILGHNLGKYFGYNSAERAGLDIYKKTLSHVFRLDLFWQEREGSGNKMKRIDRGRDGVNEMIRRVFDVMIEVVVNTVGIIFIFSTLNTVLSLSLIFFIATYFVLGSYFLGKASKQEKLVSVKFEELNGLTFESLNNIMTIKSLGITKGITQVVESHLTILLTEIKKRILLFRVRSTVLGFYYRTFELLLIIYIIVQIWQGNYTASLLILFVGLFQKVGDSASELTDLAQETVVNKIWVSRAMELLKADPIIEHPEAIAKQVSYPKNWKKLSIKELSFAYPKGDALKNISFEVKRGESVGIVGLSGAGKSTLFKLLLDLHEDYTGEILLDDTSLKDIRRQSYIDNVSVVLQDTELFNMSLGSNIEIAKAVDGKTAISLAEAIHMAHLDEVVAKLSNGIDTTVGEKGTKLSGGQRQRVGIARALYRQPDILLMDEATSHLDGHSEKQIQEALAENIHSFTTIVIAHRLATIQKMDKIIVLEKGQIKEMGTFIELVKKDGTFAKMWTQQKL